MVAAALWEGGGSPRAAPAGEMRSSPRRESKRSRPTDGTDAGDGDPDGRDGGGDVQKDRGTAGV